MKIPLEEYIPYRIPALIVLAVFYGIYNLVPWIITSIIIPYQEYEIKQKFYFLRETITDGLYPHA